MSVGGHFGLYIYHVTTKVGVDRLESVSVSNRYRYRLIGIGMVDIGIGMIGIGINIGKNK